MNNVKEWKLQSFPTYSVKEWEEAARDSLKNNSIDILKRNTYENIILKPLYTKEDVEITNLEQFPNSGLNTRGFQPYSHQQNNWKIAQKLIKDNWDELCSMLSDVLQRGQEVLSFDIDRITDVEHVNFSEIENLDLLKTSIFLNTKDCFTSLLSILRKLQNKEQIKGVIGTDIISRGVEQGIIVNPLGEESISWTNQIKEMDQDFNALKTIIIDTTPYHNGGANAIQEIAIALSEAVYYIELMKREKWTPGKTAQKMVFHFSIGSNFFMEIAKIRAFRKLWSTIANAYEMTLSEQIVPISAETSSFNKSVLDPYVNLLRAGNEAFSAILGGVDYLHVSAFDETFQESNEFSARISRNIQYLLREEAHLNKVCDPAGGSYYIETLTNELAVKAWELFQLIDLKGGINAVLESGWLQNEIQNVLKDRLEDIATRKQSLIGTNIYANLLEEETFPPISRKNSFNSELSLNPFRLSEEFENLRKQSKLLEKDGHSLIVGLICLNQLRRHKARADFASGFLACGGIKTVWSKECSDLKDIEKFVEETNFPYYCICGDDDSYESLVYDIAVLFKGKYTNKVLDIAGKFSNEKWSGMKKNGINGSIYTNQNVIEKLSKLLTLWR